MADAKRKENALVKKEEEETKEPTEDILLPEIWERILSYFNFKEILSKRCVTINLNNAIDLMLHEKRHKANESLWTPHFATHPTEYEVFQQFRGIRATRFRSYEDIAKFLKQMEPRTTETTPFPTGMVICLPRITADFRNNPLELYNHFLKLIELYGKHIVTLVHYNPILRVENGPTLFAKALENILHCENLINLVVFYDRGIANEYTSSESLVVLNSPQNSSFPKKLRQLQIFEINYRPYNDQDSMIITLRNLKGASRNLTHFRLDWHPNFDGFLTKNNLHLFDLPNVVKLKLKMITPNILEIFQNSEGEAALPCLRQLTVRLSDKYYWVEKRDKETGQKINCLLGRDLDVVANIRQLLRILDESYANKVEHLGIDYHNAKKKFNLLRGQETPLGGRLYPKLKHFVISFDSWLQMPDFVTNILHKFPRLEKVTISECRTHYDGIDGILAKHNDFIIIIWENSSASLREIYIQSFERTLTNRASNV